MVEKTTNLRDDEFVGPDDGVDEQLEADVRAVVGNLLPSFAFVEYQMLVGGLFGDTLAEVVRHALVSFLHDRALTFEKFISPEARAQLEDAEAQRLLVQP